jgi:hypothetical protein
LKVVRINKSKGLWSIPIILRWNASNPLSLRLALLKKQAGSFAPSGLG